jgi:RING-like zinc finger
MGQAASRASDGQPQGGPQRRRRLSTALRSTSFRTARDQNTLRSSSRITPETRTPRPSSRLYRARSSIYNTLPNLITRHRNQQSRSTQTFSMPPTPMEEETPQVLRALTPDFSLPPPPSADIEMDLGADFDELPALISPPEQTPHRHSHNLSDRIRDLMPRHTLRRRRSRSLRVEDQTAMLTELLSAAAAATAASILGDSPSQPRTLVGDENGAFESFLQALRNGSIASALRSNPSADGSTTGEEHDLNFFRMFRFGATETPRSQGSQMSGEDNTSSTPDPSDGTTSQNDGGGNGNGDGRMVPIIIVGIRSINPGSSSNDNNMPPFFDSLSNFPPTTPTDTTVDGLLRPARTNAAFSHRRRTSMTSIRGANAPQSMNDGSSSASSETARPFSATSDSFSNPRPPPSTPASAGLSAFSSGATTPTTTASPSVGSQSAVPSRRGSFIRRAGNNLESTAEEPTAPRPIPRQRRFSEDFDLPRYGAGSSRRNGLVGPDAPEDMAGEPHRSWIIYVLGGSYPENHPLLATPSLFTDNPQYEDMLHLASVLGPAKPPVATEEEVSRANGLFRIESFRDENGKVRLRAVELDGSGVVNIGEEDRCLVCLCDFEPAETARRLAKCRHFFHKECIDQVSSPIPHPISTLRVHLGVLIGLSAPGSRSGSLDRTPYPFPSTHYVLRESPLTA